MSYDLYFWRPAPDLALPPAEICEAIASRDPPLGLLRIDVETALLRIERAFPGSTRTANQIVWQGPDPKAGSFVIGWSDVHIDCECHQLPAESMNLLIDIGTASDCRLYDPQANTLFDGSSTPNNAPSSRLMSPPVQDLIRNVHPDATGSLEGEVFFGLFRVWVRFVVEDSAPIEYVNACAVYLSSLSERLILQLCEASIRYRDELSAVTGQPSLSFPEPRGVLGEIAPRLVIIPNPKHGLEPALHVELDCTWEVEHGLEWVARSDSALYVGAFDGEDPWDDFEEKEPWNYA